MTNEEIRTLTLRALARGWLTPEDVWDLARQSAADERAGALEASLRTLLDDERLHTLTLDAALFSSSAPPPPELDPTTAPAGAARYELRDLIGRGAEGRVEVALDKLTTRVVALKTSTDVSAEHRTRFLREARITARLEHPSIVPIYDVGWWPNGTPYYSMRIVGRRSLRDVLGSPEARARWPLARLLRVVEHVARALAYAHAHGVAHRDVKPANVLLGDFGEVYLADWGLARSDEQEAGRADLVGTPGYIAPEVVGGEGVIDHRVDLFALGAILYEVLVGRRAIEGQTIPALLEATLFAAPLPPRAFDPQCPPVLDALCTALLAPNPSKRPLAQDAADAIEEFLEGEKEAERSREEARRLCANAGSPVVKYEALHREGDALLEMAREKGRAIKPWEPVPRKRDMWSLESQARDVQRTAGQALAAALDLYTKALGHDPACKEAHRGIAELYWKRAQNAARERNLEDQAYYEALVAEHDPARYGAMLGAPGRLSVRSNPVPAEVFAQPWVERDRVLVRGDVAHLGSAPLEIQLEPGSWLVTLRAPGYRDVRCPVLLERGARASIDVNLYTDAEIGDGFVYVPGGLAILGGDASASQSLPRQEIDVPDFAIARFPVVFREYCAFLDDIEREDPALALKRAPHDLRGSEGLAVVRGRDGKWEPSPLIIEGDARSLFPPADGHVWNVPVSLVDWFDARAFCRWRSDRGDAMRLPTEAEREKAARGVDGRFFPWGDDFDATFCKMRESRPFAPQPEPVGTFSGDESPYGARDLAGGTREWVADILGERSAAELDSEPEPGPEVERGDAVMCCVRGGAWSTDAQWCRAASRGLVPALVRGTGLGFRLAKTLRRRA